MDTSLELGQHAGVEVIRAKDKQNVVMCTNCGKACAGTKCEYCGHKISQTEN